MMRSLPEMECEQRPLILHPGSIPTNCFLQLPHQFANFIVEFRGHGMHESGPIWVQNFQSVVSGVRNSFNSHLKSCWNYKHLNRIMGNKANLPCLLRCPRSGRSQWQYKRPKGWKAFPRLFSFLKGLWPNLDGVR